MQVVVAREEYSTTYRRGDVREVKDGNVLIAFGNHVRWYPAEEATVLTRWESILTSRPA